MRKYEIKMMNGDILEITEEVANKLIGKSGLIALTGIGIINLNSVVSVLPKGLVKTKEDTKTIKCHGGVVAIKQFGKWIDRYSGVELSLSHYPELKEENLKLEAPSEYAKQLCEKITN